MTTEHNSEETEYNPDDNLRIVNAETLMDLRARASFLGGRDERAQHTLGRLYFFGAPGVPRNPREGLKWLFKAARQGDEWAQYDFGSICFQAKQYEIAVPWLLKAADQEHSMARYLLALCYYGGLGVEKDRDAAIRQMRALATKPESRQGLDLPDHFEAKEKAQQFLDQIKTPSPDVHQSPGPEQALG